MTGRIGLTRQQLRSLARISNRRSIGRLTAHLGLIAASGTLVWLCRPGAWMIPAMAVHGALLVFLFAPLHESVHRTVFSGRRANDLLAFALGLPLLLPPTWFRLFHRDHHRFTQDPERDPELAVPRPASRLALLWHLSGLPYWAAAVDGLVCQALGRAAAPFVPPREERRVARDARLYLAIYAAIAVASFAAGSTAVLWLWVMPALLGQPLLRVFLLSEHVDLPYGRDMLANSRTTRTLAPVRWIAWNMPFHAEHHAYPAIPFHALPAAHRQIAGRLPSVAPGYLRTTRAAWTMRPWRAGQE